MPLQAKILVRNPHGIHMRPSMAFAKLAAKYKSTVTIRKPDRTANGKSMTQIMTLAAREGTELVLEVDGEDAAAALPILAAALAAPSAEAMLSSNP